MGRVTPAIYHSRIAELAALPSIHAAFRWFHLEERRIMSWQRELVATPAPPFGEAERARLLADHFRSLGLESVTMDAAGNVLGTLGGRQASSSSEKHILLSAHIDTAFPAGTPITVIEKEHHLQAPGACDNGAGLAALLAVAAAIQASGCRPDLPILFAGNVGEEGEGDLRGMRYLYQAAGWKHRIAAHVVLDGAGAGVAVTEALGSRRYLASLEAPGGHSWADAGSPNTIVWMAEAITAFEKAARECRAADSQPTAWNVGTIQGGSSVNSIPERTEARFDLRSLDSNQLIRLEVALHRAMEDAAAGAGRELGAHRKARRAAGRTASAARNQVDGHEAARGRSPVRFEIRKIGDRPPGQLPADDPLIQILRAVDRHLGIRTQEHAASTDANIPLSLGIPAISIGAGGTGGGIHTRDEWYDAVGRDLALRRILLLLLGI